MRRHEMVRALREVGGRIALRRLHPEGMAEVQGMLDRVIDALETDPLLEVYRMVVAARWPKGGEGIDCPVCGVEIVAGGWCRCDMTLPMEERKRMLLIPPATDKIRDRRYHEDVRELLGTDADATSRSEPEVGDAVPRA